MKALTGLLLVGLLALWIGLPFTSSFRIPVLPWSCPRNPFKCTIPGIHRCRYDYDCPGRQRCCYYNCNRICR
ncbi:waprin-Enh1-like [Python bivittatus]|uniref:Waprin-Enh1-like n=1 Tax=Python bivittatus TaxID=176946 RepID=A0A9F5JBH7_PYTBI|nr:waprin-Enh1-like [Python bivittatus]